MPGDMSKYKKYMIDKPYPEPRVEERSREYAKILMGDYAGYVSELTAINLYIYQHVSSDKRFKEYAELIAGVSIAEMKHLELLGETIRLLGTKPVYASFGRTGTAFWNGRYINYTDTLKGMLLEDIKAETAAIENYRKHREIIKDKYIDNLIDRILLDENLHLKLFNDFNDKVK